MVSKVKFYGEQLDFFFLAASVSRADSSKEQSVSVKKRSVVHLKPDKF